MNSLEIPVFVYQMGKVASTSIYKSLKKQYNGICVHAHSFSVKHPKPEVSALFRAYQEQGISIKIISLVREPISRNISAFFQNFERDTGFKFKHNPYSTKELMNVFLEKYNHKIPLLWFDNNIKYNFGIDVFQRKFPKRGYDFYENEKIKLLVLRHDIEDSKKEKIISEYIGINNFAMYNFNIGSKKKYSSEYKKFKTISIPKKYLDSMLNSKYSNHFFSNDIKSIRMKYNSH